MSDLKKFIEREIERSPEFKVEYELESARLALVRARTKQGISQAELAERLGVSQPRIAQVERGSKPMSALFMMRYASEVGAKVQIVVS